MIKKLYQVIFLLFTVQLSFAQMTDNGQTRYGNEWIVDGALYYKIKVTEDGIYKLDQTTLKNAGFQGDIIGSSLQLFKNGVEIPIKVTQNNTWASSDYLTFNGYYNKSEIDKYSFPGSTDDIVNPKASMYSDTAAYFLTVNSAGNNLRTTLIDNNLSNLPTQEEYIIRISEMDFRDMCNIKTEYSGTHAFVNSPFTQGKGMVSSQVNQPLTIECPGLIPSSRLTTFSLRGVTNPGDIGLNLGHDLKFFIQDKLMYNAASITQQVLYVNFKYTDIDKVIKAGNNTMTLTNGHGNDLVRYGYAGIEYAASPELSDDQPLKFHLEANGSDRYLSFNLNGVTVSNPYLTDSLGSWTMNGIIEGNNLKFKIPASQSLLSLTLFPNARLNSVSNIKSMNLRSFGSFNPGYVILSHPLLLNSSGGKSAIDEYADYRRSAQGGGYAVEVVNVFDLYNSFAYGLDYNPMAVKNFSNYLKLNSTSKFMFIIGRGRDYKEIRTSSALQTAINKGYGVPSFGDFGSDNLLVSRSFDKLDLNLAVGRLPAVTQDEVRIYLNKIKNSDQAYNAQLPNEEKQWTKQVIQLNGGNVGGPDQVGIADGQREAQNIIETNKFAGFVTTFIKGSNETIGKASEDYFKLVNQGVSIVDYFGHGALASLEYPIDIPSKYSNSPRLPILIIKGCKTGNCQRDGTSIPAKFLYEDSYKNSGFRAVIGSISDSDLYSLSALARQFYTLLGGTLYGKTLGEVFQSTFSTPGLNLSSESIQQLYVGDPALSIAPFPGPDFTIVPNSVKTNPDEITSIENKFEVSFDINNLGTSTTDTLFYTATYENPAKKNVKSVSKFVINPPSTGNYKFDFELDKTDASGESTIYLTVDPNNKIAEAVAPQAELNNEYKNSLGTKGYKFFIKTSAIEAVYPSKYSIIDTNKVTVSAYSQALSEAKKNYTFSLDTSDLFNSPLLESKVIISAPGHIEWQPDNNLLENVVYYWRVSSDSVSSIEPFLVTTSSFTFMKGKSGYSQSHNGQFREDDPKNLIIKGGGNNIKFGLRNYNFKYNNGFVNNVNSEYISGISNDVNFRSFKSHLDFSNYNDGLIGVVWFKRDSFLHPYYSGQAPFGSIPVPNIDVHFYLMYEANSKEGRIAMVNYIEDVIPDEDIVFLFTHVKEAFPTLHEQDWAQDSITNNGRNIFNTLEKRGARLIRNMLNTGSKPYTIMFDKKTGELLDEDMATGNEIINSECNMLCHSDFGSIVQTFGASGAWKSFEFQPKPLNGKIDSLIYTLTAIHRSDPLSNYVITQVSLPESIAQNVDISNVDANTFPNIKLDLRLSEPTLYGGQLDGFEFIRFYSKELPEATLIQDPITFDSDSIKQGQPFTFEIKSKNIGRLEMDSMSVKFTMRSSENFSIEKISRFEKLPVKYISDYKFTFDTKTLKGKYDFICEMNPDNDQVELFHGNNIFTRKLYVQGDNENPLVDATFDGERIFNGDIISSKPLIKITIRDENKLFPLDDPGLFNLSLVNSFGQDTLIPLNSAEIKFFPADPAQISKKNEAVIEYKPDFSTYPPNFSSDGEFSIRITATDVAGNQSGKYDFEKRFRIINKKSVSNVFNYPNPFSNATRFVFTLTGFELPTYYKIQIMSVSGKIVKEITQNELGPLKIGKHMTDYIWNGTDEYGDKLANGVYLYRMIIMDQDKKKYEKLEDGQNINQYFDGDWGKLVIIR